MPEAAGLLMLALKTWSPPPVSNTSPILNTNLLTHSVTLLLLLTPYLQSESAPAPLIAGHLLSIQLLIPGHRRPTAGLQPALKPGRPVLSRGLGGLPTSGSLCTAPTPPPPSPHSASSTTCSLLPKTTFSEPRTAWSSFSILFAFSNTLLLYRGSRNPQSRYFVQE